MDALQDWFSAHTVADPQSRLTCSELHASYMAYLCANYGGETVAHMPYATSMARGKVWAGACRSLGLKAVRTNTQRLWAGVRLVP